jgi:hypothetical protein
MIKGFLKDAAKYLPAQIAPAIVGFISIPIITRLFAPEDYGNYSLVMATVMILVTLVGWLSMSIIRFYPAYERDNKLDFFCGNIIKLTFISNPHFYYSPFLPKDLSFFKIVFTDVRWNWCFCCYVYVQCFPAFSEVYETSGLV